MDNNGYGFGFSQMDIWMWIVNWLSKIGIINQKILLKKPIFKSIVLESIKPKLINLNRKN